MNTLEENNIKVERIWFTQSEIFIETIDGQRLSHPLAWFPKLNKATKEQRENYEISPFGIHWLSLDEDLSFRGFFDFNK